MIFRISLGLIGIFASLATTSGKSSSESDVVELAPQVVTASPFVTDLAELVVPANEIAGADLNRRSVSSLGATLDGQPGVHSTYNGPGSGRPVIRGFDGDRVRILNQGTDSFDVSQTSPDHGVSIEPLFAHEIEVVRGPASLLYGNAAIGGVVNVMGKELPRERASRRLSGEFEASYGSAADEKSAGLALQGGQDDVAWSVGYLERDSGDLEIPGFAESTYQMELEEQEHGEEHEEGDHEEDEHGEEETFGVLENSFVDTRSGYAGLAWFGDRGSLGISFSKYETEYGVPGHEHGEEHEDEEGHETEVDDHGHGEEGVSIDLDQSRFTLRGELLDPTEFWENVELDFSYGDYRHIELEGDEVGTTFDRDGFELRLTGIHRPFGLLTGAIGLHIKEDSLAAKGEEAFIPSNEVSQHGLFVVERLNRDWGAWEFGGRIEKVEIDSLEAASRDRSFTTSNASVGMVRRLNEISVASANLTYAERAPNGRELYAFGPHTGTQSFEIGDADLGIESSVNLDLSYRLVAGKVTGEFTVFYSDFSNYVYQRFLDEEEVEELYEDLDTEGLGVFQATASDARFYGYEIDLRFHLIDEAERAMHFSLLADYTRATNESFDSNLPRIPTRRIGGRYEYAAGPWLFGLEGRYHYSASHLAPLELPTDSYFLFGSDLRYRIQSTETAEIDLFIVGSNLGDKEARPHTSFVKDIAPLPGRNIRIGVRSSF